MTARRRGRGHRARKTRRSDPDRASAVPAPSQREVERFAHAAEIGHDPEFADELAVIAVLRGLGTTPALDEATRARITRRVTATPPPGGTRRRRRWAPVTVAALVVLVALSGLGLSAARDALPGGPMYDLKRTQEVAALGLTFDDEAKARKHLAYAERRLDEIAGLVREGVRSEDGYQTALHDFTRDVTEGARTLTVVATRSDGRRLDWLRSWATTHAGRLRDLETRLPVPVTAPVTLLTRIERRATALAERLPCYRITSIHSDDLGPLPAAGPCGAPDTIGVRRESPAQAGPQQSRETPVDRFDGVTEAMSSTPPTTPLVPPAAPTPPLSTTTTTAAPTAVPPPILAPMPPSPPDTPGDTPVVSIPPLLPGLPGVRIG